MLSQDPKVVSALSSKFGAGRFQHEQKALEITGRIIEASGRISPSNLRENYSADIIRFFQEKHLIEARVLKSAVLQAFFDGVEPSQPLGLNPEQEIAQREILSQVGQEAQTYLLQGVTGSGKTEAHLAGIEGSSQKGKTAIMLVPEISLTPQVTRHELAWANRWPSSIRVCPMRKILLWRKIDQQPESLSEPFRYLCPQRILGLSPITKSTGQIHKMRVNPVTSWDVAKLRADYHQVVPVLGSATPVLESRARASRGPYGLLHLI